MTRFFAATLCLIVSPASAQVKEELEVARRILTELQAPSFAMRREYCGYIGINAKGKYVAGRAEPGDEASCGMDFPDGIAVTASYHTHGPFDANYFGEVPSGVDMEGDKRLRISGYISTPGGRFWYVDSREMVAHQICGIGCLPVAPGFYKGSNDEIKDQYTYEELLDKLNER